MTDEEVDKRAKRNTRIVKTAWVLGLPVTLPWTIIVLTGFRALFGWWPWQEPWSGDRYKEPEDAKNEDPTV